MKRASFIASFGLVCALLGGQPAHAVPMIAFEWTEGGPGNGTNSVHQSQHQGGGPVLADDFVAALSGNVVQVDWWGSQNTPTAQLPWEITFHTDNGGVPAVGPVAGGIDQHFVASAGADADGDGVFFFSAAWPQVGHPGDPLTLSVGTKYWFSVANLPSPNGWTWANAGGLAPTVGLEQFNGAVSNPGGGGSPHFGPWNAVSQPDGSKQDFAFRIWVDSGDLPEPSTMLLFGSGLAGFVGWRYKKQRKS